MKHDDSIGSQRLIRLVQQACLIVYPPGDATSDSFHPFWFTCMPRSQSCWLQSLAEIFHRTYGKCIAVLLTLDCETHQWSAPVIPTQRCTRDGTIWVLRNEDFADMPPSRRVVGSCQSGVADGPEDIVARLPPHDGLHLFLRHSNHKWIKYWFLRIQGEVAFVPPTSVLADDGTTTFETPRQRVDLGSDA